jgi:uncharacterized cupredoxin-like copper-binding protein
MKRRLAAAAVLCVTGALEAGSARVALAYPTQAQGADRARLITTVKVTAKEFKFVLSQKTASRGLVVFKVTNVGALKHDFAIKGRKTRQLSHGQSATLRATFLRTGHYDYKCTVPGHAEAGMKGVFTIVK